MGTIYLDYNATTPIAPEVREAMLPFLTDAFGNPSSSHALGGPVHDAVEAARQSVAELIGAESGEVFFTSGGTESNNLALLGTFAGLDQPGRNHLVISTLEHPAIEAPARHLEAQGYAVTRVGPTRHGVIEPESIARALRAETALVSVMHANNEIGTIQPIREIARICRRRGVLVHTDAAQSIGKIPANVDELAVDLMSIAGHKFYAAKGVGALYVRRGTPIRPIIHGAGQEAGLRPGTENTASIVGLGRAASIAAAHIKSFGLRLARHRDRLLDRLRTGTNGAISVHGERAPRIPNTLSVSFPGVRGNELLQRVAELCASTGAACHSGCSPISTTLAAIGLTSETAQGTVRLSVGWFTTDDDVVRASDRLIVEWEQLRRES